MHTRPDTTAIMPASATARIGSPPDSGSTTARITRGQRGVRPQHQDAAGTEQRVSEQRDDGGVQAVDAGDARCHRVGDSDRHQHRGQHEAGHQVVGQPGDLVPAQRLQSGQPALPARRIGRQWPCQATGFRLRQGRSFAVHTTAGSGVRHNGAPGSRCGPAGVTKKKASPRILPWHARPRCRGMATTNTPTQTLLMPNSCAVGSIARTRISLI